MRWFQPSVRQTQLHLRHNQLQCRGLCSLSVSCQEQTPRELRKRKQPRPENQLPGSRTIGTRISPAEFRILKRISDKLFPVNNTDWVRFWEADDWKTWYRRWRILLNQEDNSDPSLPTYERSVRGQMAWIKRAVVYLKHRPDFRQPMPRTWPGGVPEADDPTVVEEFDPDWDDWDFRAMMEKRRVRERERREWLKEREKISEYKYIDTISMDIRIPEEEREGYNMTEKEAWDVITQNGTAYDPRVSEPVWEEASPNEVPDWAGTGNKYVDDVVTHLKKTGLMVDNARELEQANEQLEVELGPLFEGMDQLTFEQALLPNDDENV